MIQRYSDPEVMDLFKRHGVLSESEQLARQEILFHSYVVNLHIETKLVSSIGRSVILPAGLRWLKELGEAARLAGELAPRQEKPQQPLMEEEYYNRTRAHVEGLLKALDKLDATHARLDTLEGTEKKAEAARDDLLPLMAECRAHADALENMVDDAIWPLPKYNELLW